MLQQNMIGIMPPRIFIGIEKKMITTRKQLKEILCQERELYIPKRSSAEWILTSDNRFVIYKYVRILRYTEYHYNNRNKLLHKLLYVFCRRRKCILGRQLGIEMWENTFDSGLKIWHPGNIVVNGHSKIGKNCQLHGSNCIGNNGITSLCPKLGDNVNVGVGAKIIGGVELANNVTVAAGAVVIRSCLTEGAVLAGVPAKCVKIN